MTEVTQILSRIDAGDPAAVEKLLPIVYEELRTLAAVRLAHEGPGQTLQATALVHEVYLRLVRPGDHQESWDHRGHFFAAAAEAMRRILVERARRKKSQKRGGDRVVQGFCEDVVPSLSASAEDERILAVHEALSELETEAPRKAQLVKLRFFVGMTLEEAATALGVAVPTAKRDWAAARVWLYRWMSE